MRGTRFMAALAAVAFGAGLMASPAAAKCSKECKIQIKDEFKATVQACKALPGKKKDKKICIKIFAKPAKKTASQKCKANSGTPPSCGSPSGAFVDSSLD